MAMTLVEHAVVTTTGITQITISNIPQTGRHLLLTTSLRIGGTGVFDSNSPRFNGSDLNTMASEMRADGSTVTSSRGGSIVFVFNGSTATANTFSSGSLYFPNYTSSASRASALDQVAVTNANSGVTLRITATNWNSTSSLTSITAFSSSAFVQQSSMSLYIIS